MELKLAIKGQLKSYYKAIEDSGALSTYEIIFETTEGAQDNLRRQIQNAGLGRRLPNTWQKKIFPAGKPSMNAKGLLFNTAPEIITAFNEGVTIRSSNGLYLAIPTEAAGQFAGRKSMTPELWEQRRGQQLRFVYVNSKVSLLVADNMRAGLGKRGGFRKASASALRSGRGLATVVMFILVRQVSLRKRLDIEAAIRPYQTDIAPRIGQRWEQNLGRIRSQYGVDI